MAWLQVYVMANGSADLFNIRFKAVSNRIGD
jgi:hypothetical protein